MSLFYHSIIAYLLIVFFFFFNDTATTEIYTLSLHDALPIFAGAPWLVSESVAVTLKSNAPSLWADRSKAAGEDRKSTRLNSSHSQISYAVFCLKKKKIDLAQQRQVRGLAGEGDRRVGDRDRAIEEAGDGHGGDAYRVARGLQGALELRL